MTTDHLGVHLETTPFGRPALDALARHIADAKGADPLAPVTVLVPNNFVGVATRRALASGDHGAVATGAGAGVAAVDFLTIYRLAELLGAPVMAAGRRRPVSTPIIAAAVRAELRAAPGMFSAVAEHPTTEQRLVAAHRELSDVDDANLAALAQTSRRASEVVRLHRGVKRRLDTGWFGEQDLVEAATSIAADPTTPLPDLGPVIVALPEELSVGRSAFVRALAQRTKVTVLLGQTGDAGADTITNRVADQLGLAEPPAIAPVAQPVVHATNVSDPDDEVRHVVRSVISAAAAGVRFDRMAVVYASDQPYARLLHDHLGAAGVPHNGAAVGGLHESVAGRTLMRILRLADRDLRRDDVIGLISSLPFRWAGRAAPTRAWDQISRAAGVVRGIDDWQLRLGKYLADRRAELERYADDPDAEWRVLALQRTMERTDELLAFIGELHADLLVGRSEQSWSAHVRWCRRVLRRFLGDLGGWPAEQVAAADSLDGILERLAGLDRIDPDPTPAIFRRTLEMELEGGLGRIGRLGQGVLVGRAWATAGLALDRIWVLGLAEGMFPSRPRDDSLLPDRERMVTAGQLPLRAERTAHEQRHLLAAIAAVAPDGEAHLLRSRGDLRASTERAPSRWLSALEPSPAASDTSTVGEPWEKTVASFASGLLTSEFPGTQQEFDLRDLVSSPETPDRASSLAATDRDFAAALDMQAARRDAEFSRFDGRVGRALAPDVHDGLRSSATALESWASCPHKYFVRQVLGIQPLDTPEQRLRLDALSRGSVVHAILERFVDRAIERGDADVLTWSPADRVALQDIATEEFDQVEALGLTGEPLYWRRDQVLIRRELDRFIVEDNARRRADGLRPLHTELAFGMGGAAPVTIDLAGGHRIVLRGSVDLVDIATDGTLHVVDYKTGSLVRMPKESPIHAGGTKLQLGLYAQAVRQLLDRRDAAVNSQYWFVSEKGEFKPVGYEVTAEVLDDVNRAVALIVDHIARGWFPLRPVETTRGNFVPCEYCDPDGLGVNEQRRRYEALARLPELADFIALVEPKLLPAPTLLAVDQ